MTKKDSDWLTDKYLKISNYFYVVIQGIFSL